MTESVTYVWGITHKKWNKEQHALHGNGVFKDTTAAKVAACWSSEKATPPSTGDCEMLAKTINHFQWDRWEAALKAWVKNHDGSAADGIAKNLPSWVKEAK